MIVVVEQTKAVTKSVVFLNGIRKRLEKVPTVIVAMKNVLAGVLPRGDMVYSAGIFYS